MSLIHVSENGIYTIGNETFTEDELVEKIGYTLASKLKQTAKTTNDRIETLAMTKWRREKAKHDLSELQRVVRENNLEKELRPYPKSSQDFMGWASTSVRSQR